MKKIQYDPMIELKFIFINIKLCIKKNKTLNRLKLSQVCIYHIN